MEKVKAVADVTRLYMTGGMPHHAAAGILLTLLASLESTKVEVA